MFIDKVKKLCSERGESLASVIQSLNLSQNSSTRWSKGQTPNAMTAKRLADYFDVSVDYLLSDDENDLRYKPLSENEQTMLRLFGQLRHDSQLIFIGRLEEYVERENLSKN